jgi:vitamin B12 transporter
VVFKGGVYTMLLVAVGLSVTGKPMAQQDSVLLTPVNVQGFVPERFMSGLKIQHVDSATLLSFRFQNIGDLLAMNSPIALKNYGPGQLTTASFRGTSASHTAVLWNGLNINSLTLGQTDFSTIPVAAFDRMSIQFGSAASVVGSDAVGGSVLLNSGKPATGFGVTLGGQVESFDNHQIQLSTRYNLFPAKSSGLSGKTAFYTSRMNNHFPYTKRRGYAMLPSETFQRGIVQDLFFKPKHNQQLSAHIWLTNNELTVNPDYFTGRERTNATAYRTMIRYEIGDWAIRTSWVRDILDFGVGDYADEDHAVSDKFTTRVEKSFLYNLWSMKMYVVAGAEWSGYRARIAGYGKSLITENREDLFLLNRIQATDRWVISLNLRQAFTTGYDPPFTPSVGTEYQLVKNNSHVLRLKGSVGRSYRVPTLNERYWRTLGNAEIKAEAGINKELGIDEQWKINSHHSLTASLSAYHNRIRNWTYWNPSKSYHVENLMQVLARGVEAQLGWSYTSGTWHAGWKATYALTRSTQEKAYDVYSRDVIGKQLTYIPIHQGTVIAYLAYKKIRMSVQSMLASKRFNTTDNSTFMAGYGLANVLAERTFTGRKFNAQVQGRVNNLTNTFYVSVTNNAMPGRSFAVSLILRYNNY